MTCPACGAHSSSVLRAFEEDASCPYCGLSATAAAEVLNARRSAADTELTQKYAEAVIRADKAETRAARLARALDSIRSVLESTVDG